MTKSEALFEFLVKGVREYGNVGGFTIQNNWKFKKQENLNLPEITSVKKAK